MAKSHDRTPSADAGRAAMTSTYRRRWVDLFCVVLAVAMVATSCTSAVDDAAVATASPTPESAFDVVTDDPKAEPSSSPTTSATAGAEATPGSESIADMVERVRDGVVFIEVKGCDAFSTGSGFVVADNLVVTAAHVVTEADSILVSVDDYRSEADIVEIDTDLDLALLHVPIRNAGWHFSFADDTRIGDQALVMGYPGELDFTVTQGSVTAVDASDPYVEAPVIRYDAAANPGNSGGPVVNAAGEVLGVVSGSRLDLQDTNYAIDGTVTERSIEAWSGFDARPPDANCPEAAPPDEPIVTVTADHPEADAVRSVLEVYVSGINTGHPEYAWAMITDRFKEVVGPYEGFIEGNKTSFIYNFELSDVTDTDMGLAAQVSFVSTQDPSHGPNGWPCAVWAIDYDLVNENGSWQIDGARNRNGSPSNCEF